MRDFSVYLLIENKGIILENLSVGFREDGEGRGESVADVQRVSGKSHTRGLEKSGIDEAGRRM